jgi:hypothetical protein
MTEEKRGEWNRIDRVYLFKFENTKHIKKT